MHVFERISDFRLWRRQELAPIEYVASLGGLHAGHGALIEAGRSRGGRVVCSLFLNPRQFGPTEDLGRYPASLEEDIAYCEREGVSAVFAPTPDELFPGGFATIVRVDSYRGVLCDRARPRHFDAVCTIVAMLLQIVDPDRVYFGKKDYQQMRFIERMVADLHFMVQVVEVETVREHDGLAMSTRNRYLSPRHRRVAASIFKGLRASRDMYQAGHTDPSTVLAAGRSLIERQPARPRVEYFEAVNRRTLMPVTAIDEETLIATAVHVGGARLIDNIEIAGPDRLAEPTGV